MDVRRLVLTPGSEELVTVLKNLKEEPILVGNFFDFFPHSREPVIASLGSMSALASIETDELVGVVDPRNTSTIHSLAFEDAIAQLNAGGGYINGWEYFHSPVGSVLSEFDALIDKDSLITKLGPGGRMLDSVMRWIFISNNFENAGSDWHVDPVGSAAFMLMVVGSKRWFLADGKYETVLCPGNLLLVPPGMNHRIENVGSGLNVAISHNWVPLGFCDRMWAEVDRALSLFHSQGPYDDISSIIEQLSEEGKIDNLLMGLLMVLLQSDAGLHPLVPEHLRSVIASFPFI